MYQKARIFNDLAESLFTSPIFAPPYHALISIKNRKTQNIIFCVVFTILVFIITPILYNPSAISLPHIDRGQYIEGSTAVWGAEDLMETIRKNTTNGKRALILAEGNFGLIADVLNVYIKPQDRIDIRGLWPLNEEHILAAREETGKYDVFVVFSHRKDFPVYWRDFMSLMHVYEKPNNSPDAVYLYKVLPHETP